MTTVFCKSHYRYRIIILLATFLAYTCYHMSRKPISVVKTRLLNCTGDDGAARLARLAKMSAMADQVDDQLIVPATMTAVTDGPLHDEHDYCTSFISKYLVVLLKHYEANTCASAIIIFNHNYSYIIYVG